MSVPVALCVLLAGALSLVEGDVVANFEDIPECVEYFYQGKVPGWGAATPGAARLCQRFYNRYHFATLYDNNHRIAVYSAYRFQPSNGGGREKRWFVEPQLVNLTWGAEMKDGYWLGKDHPGVYLGERQALNEDYTHSGLDRGHLNPNGHHAVPSRNATFTLTNVVPQNPKLNQNAWARHESQLTDLFKAQCAQAYVLVGAIPSTDNWIVKDNVRRVNIPEYIWNAYCCVDNNGEPVRSGGATALNTEQNRVDQRSLLELNGFLQQYSNAPVGELFHNNCQAVPEE
ncbi:endonuclease domain-containing 1 protein-like [Salvelinus namaycush]|uniref:Endonuclease domain-containing 1 protein-like n=1 Tax=Salvelinus namaycush TaxID=8040 RepID=A0A8U0TU65_SALNM|nr:endonuclease domain-containing 1 protein-like [Salvelinus namaycush]